MVWRMGTLNIFFQFNLARINVIKKKKKKNFRILIYWPVKFRLSLYEKAFLTLNLRNKFVNMANLVTLNQFKCLVSPFKMLQIFFCIIFSLLAFLYFLPLHFFRSIIISLFTYIRTKTTLLLSKLSFVILKICNFFARDRFKRNWEVS